MTRNAIVDALGVLKAGRIVDLTHLVHPGIQRFGPFPAMRIETRYTVAESGFHVEQVSFVTQYGTHVDAPEHFVEGRRTLERIELEELMLPLFVLHFEDKVAADPEFIVHVDDIRRWEAEHGEIPAESFVAFSSDWYHRMEGGDMNNFDADGVRLGVLAGSGVREYENASRPKAGDGGGVQALTAVLSCIRRRRKSRVDEGS